MRRLLLALSCLFAAASVQAKDPPDTPAAAFTRAYKLPAKVTVDFRDASLKEAFQAISDQLEAKKLGVLIARPGPTAPLDLKVTFSGKDVPVAAVLDAILKPAELGYVVVSKEKDRADGWLEINKGTMRGYPPGVGPDPKTVTAPTPDTPAATAEDEKLAADKLDLAKSLQADDKIDRAKVQLKFIVKFYPGTKAAAEAKELLTKLEKP